MESGALIQTLFGCLRSWLKISPRRAKGGDKAGQDRRAEEGNPGNATVIVARFRMAARADIHRHRAW